MPTVEIETGLPALRELTNITKSLSPEVKLSLTEKGIDIKTVDTSHVAMLIIHMDKAAFPVYHVEPTSIGLDLEKMASVLRLASPESQIKLSIEKERLVVKIGNITRQMTIIDPTGLHDPKIPSFSPTTTLKMKVADILQAIRGSESISDAVTFVADSALGFTIHSEGEQDKIDSHFTASDLSAFVTEEGVTKSMYPLDFLASMVKVMPVEAEVTIGFSTAYPMRAEFTFADGNGTASFMLAPRVSED
jgi:proliferating cell nuclear antigen